MASQLEYKCPCCGGAIAFDSGLQKMKCPYCDTEFDVETLKHYDDELKQDRPDEMEWDVNAGTEWQSGETAGMRVYACKSCGGEIVGDETLAATSCPYCGNPVVLMGQFTGELKPDLIIPFKLDKEAAKRAFSEHLKGKRLLPKIFKSENHIDEIKGLYVPFWLFDARSDANIRYRAQRIRTWSDSRYNYTETSHFSLVRAGAVEFEHVPVDGSSKMEDDLMESIEPFDFNDAVPFQTAYLAGYVADKYDVSADQSVSRINDRVKQSTENVFASTAVGYTGVVPENSNIRLSNGKAKYAMYPVWIMNTTWNGQKFRFAMNGQTGKFVGNLPTDKGALLRWLFGVGFAASAVAFLISYLMWLF